MSQKHPENLTETRIACDQEGCTAECVFFIRDDIETARANAESVGWQLRSDKDYCPGHRT